jgi:hypothetical protein
VYNYFPNALYFETLCKEIWAVQDLRGLETLFSPPKLSFLHSLLSVIFFELTDLGAPGSAMVEALRYKPEGRGSIPDGVIGIVH